MVMDKLILREPLKNPIISQEFGKDFKVWVDGKEIWFYQGKFGLKGHPGIDYRCPNGTPIYASHDGYIMYAGFDKVNGNFIQLWNEKEGYKTLYGHLSEFKCKFGDNVKAGQVIALSGNTGDGTGPHLHFGFKFTVAGGNTKDINNGYNGATDQAQYITQDYLGNNLDNNMRFKKIKGQPHIYLVDDTKGTKMMIVDMETLNALDGVVEEVGELTGYLDKGTLVWVNRIIN